MAQEKAALTKPSSDIDVVQCDPIGACCLCGLYSAYNPEYPTQLSRHITEDEYDLLFEEINDRLSQYWPCCCCFTFGYICTICTCGLSLVCPNLCVTEAKKQLLRMLQTANKKYNRYGLHFEYVAYQCSTNSKILIYYGDPNSLKQFIGEKTFYG